jgi:hypothetical protein
MALKGQKNYQHFIKSSVSDIQDPTFLTFHLDFFPVVNSHPKGDILAFNSLFKPSETSPGSIYSNEYQMTEWPAYDWLVRYGSPWTNANASGLLEANKILKELQDSPWYFQSIVGVDQLWKSASRVKEGDKKVEITISCLESIKQPLIRLAQGYRKAIFDSDRLCYTLPDNLRTFDMQIMLFEIRDLGQSFDALDTGLHQTIFTLRRCEFDFSNIMDGSGTGEFKSYTDEKPFTTSFKIRAAWVDETTVANSDDDYYGTSIFAGVANTLTGRGQRFLQSASRLPGRLFGAILNDLQTSVENLVSENVYNRVTEVGSTDSILGRRPVVGPGATSLIGDDIYPGEYSPEKVSDLGNAY